MKSNAMETSTQETENSLIDRLRNQNLEMTPKIDCQINRKCTKSQFSKTTLAVVTRKLDVAATKTSWQAIKIEPVEDALPKSQTDLAIVCK